MMFVVCGILLACDVVLNFDFGVAGLLTFVVCAVLMCCCLFGLLFGLGTCLVV